MKMEGEIEKIDEKERFKCINIKGFSATARCDDRE